MSSIVSGDKVLHAIAGALVFAIFTVALDSAIAGFTAGVVAGLVKEGFDSLYPELHDASGADFVATVLGCAIALFGFLVIR